MSRTSQVPSGTEAGDTPTTAARASASASRIRVPHHQDVGDACLVKQLALTLKTKFRIQGGDVVLGVEIEGLIPGDLESSGHQHLGQTSTAGALPHHHSTEAIRDTV